MAYEENLKKGAPYQFQSGDKAAAAGRKGGIKSGESKRRKKNMMQAAKMLMELPTSGKNAELFEKMGIDAQDATNQMTILVAMMQKAKKGDVKAAEFMRDTMGMNPVLKQRQAESRQRAKEAAERLAFDRERFEYEKQKDAGENLEYEYLEDVEAEIYGGGAAGERGGDCREGSAEAPEEKDDPV